MASSSTFRVLTASSRIGLVLTFLLLGLGWHSSPAAACTWSERSVFFVEFEDGSAALPEAIAERFRARLLPSISGERYVASYYVLASGDVAEGAPWENAPESARAADLKLGQARSVSIRTMLEHQPRPLRTKSIDVKIRDNRQVLTEAELRANPLLNLRVRAAIVADIRTRSPRPRKGRPVPTC